MKDSLDTAVDKIHKCLDTSETIEQLHTSIKAFVNLTRLYDVSVEVERKLMQRFNDKHSEFITGVEC